jgi:hypothetical protein
MSLHDDLQLINTRTAEKLAIPRKINGVNFDGTIDISISGGGTSGDSTSIAGVPVSVASLTNGDIL